MAVLPSDLVAALLLCVLSVSVRANNPNATLPYTCSLTGDPHLHTFMGNRVTVPGPCGYTVVRLDSYVTKLKKISVATVPVEFKLMVEASNEVVAENGQYYVSDVSVRVIFFTITEGQISSWNDTTFFTSSARIRSFLNEQAPNSSVWTVDGDDQRSVVSLDYHADDGLAVLLVIVPNSGERVLLSFRPVDRQRAAAGRHQARTAGLTITVQGDLIHEDQAFPETLCSTITDLAKTPQTMARDHGLTESSIGIYAMLSQYTPQKSIRRPTIDTATCLELRNNIVNCADPLIALDQCSPLLTSHTLVSCIESNTETSAIQAFSYCTQYYCKGRPSETCRKLKKIAEACPADLPAFSCKLASHTIPVSHS